MAALVLLHAGVRAEVALLDVVLNDSPRGNFNFVFDKGEYFVARSELAKLGIKTVGPESTVDGQVVLPLTGLEGVEAVIDESALEVRLTADTARLGTQEISLASVSPYGLTPAETSFIGNFRVATDTVKPGSPLFYSENSFRHQAWLMQANLYSEDNTWRSSLLRFSRDFPSQMQRLSIGDVPNDGYAGRAMRGVWFGRAFEMKPYFQRVPGLAFTAEAAVPAMADVYVDGIRVRSVAVKPGPLSMSDLNVGAGLHATEVVLRDRAGNVLSRFTDQRYLPSEGLAEGVSDYAVSAGETSGGVGAGPSWGYNLRYARGLSPALTLGGFAQGTAGGAHYTGGQVTAVLGQFGSLSAQLTQASGVAHGQGLVAAFVRQSKHGSVQFQAERYSRGFYGEAVTDPGVRGAARYSATYQATAAAGVVFALTGAKVERMDGKGSQSLSFSVSKRWGALNVTLRGTTGHGPDVSPGVAVSLSYDLGLNQSSGAYVSASRGQVVSGADYSSVGSRQRGLGYRLATQRVGDQQDVRASGQYLHERFSTSFSADASERTGQAGVSVASTVAWTRGDGLRITRPIDGAFAVVDAKLPGVKVMMDNQYMGRTGDDGRLLVPYLTSWAQHGLTLDEQNIPLDYAVESLQRNVSLPDKAGVLLDFKVHLAQALSGRLVSADGVALGSHRVSLASPSDTLRLVTSKDGTFYTDEGPPGLYEGGLVVDGRPCQVSVRIPERKTAFLEIGDVPCTSP
ncbi:MULTISPECIES: fimbria/pilus outer membrane usher protein [unclassified Variovorax]|uniref:fimbria/pilus outer membrane usher protein n=1 Tax=unclassified Variovorax TaxID=663243 RepID=UPI0013A56C77|nr:MULTISPECIES: fimbria/pilus outer membrane usher protein [unclassified Variovorax]